jgi:16S rRNA (guanine527-N7)-methyltransferase
VLLDDSLRGVDVVRGYDGGIVDVGSGGGVPGIPLAVSLPDREVTLLEANGRKCDFLREWAPPNVRVTQGRAEEQEADVFGVAVAKALAPPHVAAEWCLPLVRSGGAVVLWVGVTAEVERVATVAAQVGGELHEHRDGLLVLRKVRPTPAGFPRRTGMARKRPLG